MIDEQLITLDRPSDWKQTLKDIKHGFAHTWENCQAMFLTKGFPTYLYSIKIGDTHIVCPISERTYGGHTDIFTPYGFSGFISNKPCPEFLAYWKKFVESRNYICGYLQLNPLLEDQSLFAANDVFNVNKVYTLDLSYSLEELYSNLSHNRKRQLKNWSEIRSHILVNDPSVLDFFLRNYHDFMVSRNASNVYNFSIETLLFLNQQKNYLMVGYQNSGKVVAASLFGYTQYLGDYLFNISVQEGRIYTTSLIWAGVTHLKSRGVEILNLGGGVRVDDKLAEYKRRFGGTEYSLKCLKQIYDQRIYNQLCQRVEADPKDKAGYFPPYQKYLMEGNKH